MDDLKSWKPSVTEFDSIVRQLVNHFCTSRAGHDALRCGDEVLAHSIFFMRDALISREFTDAVKRGDSGRVILVLKIWALGFRGNGRTKYAYEMLHVIHNITTVWPGPLRYANYILPSVKS